MRAAMGQDEDKSEVVYFLVNLKKAKEYQPGLGFTIGIPPPPSGVSSDSEFGQLSLQWTARAGRGVF